MTAALACLAGTRYARNMRSIVAFFAAAALVGMFVTELAVR